MRNMESKFYILGAVGREMEDCNEGKHEDKSRTGSKK
jgi:hypothetical protein